MPLLPRTGKSGRQALNLAALCLTGVMVAFLGCENDFSFTPPVNHEICNDGLDNDSDSFTDCRDSECGDFCRPLITLTAPPYIVAADSLVISGTHQRAASIVVTASPSGSGGQANKILSGWTFTLRNLLAGTISLKVVATDSTGQWRDSAAATFTVQGP